MTPLVCRFAGPAMWTLVAVWASAIVAGSAAAEEKQKKACVVHNPGQIFCLKRLAVPSNTRNYGGYYVGGGNIFCAGGPRPIEDGTWGWDYGGFFKNTWVKLGWNDGSRHQGGTGDYRTER